MRTFSSRCSLLLTLSVLLLPSLASAQHLWSSSQGGIGDDQGRHIAVDGVGNVIVAGFFSNSVDFGGGMVTSAGGLDIFVAKYDPAGLHLWSQGFGASGEDRALGIAVDGSGDLMVTGHFRGTVDFGGGPLVSMGADDIFAAKFDSSGSHVWSRSFGSSASDAGNAVTADGVLTGYFGGTVDFGGGPLIAAGSANAFVVKLDAAGTHLWSWNFGSPGASFDQGTGIAVDSFGSVLAIGRFDGTVDFGGGPLVSSGGMDTYLAKFTPAGSHVWSQSFGSTNSDQGWGIAVDGAGNALVTGNITGAADLGGGVLPFAGAEDIYVAKFDASGNHVWSKSFGDVGVDRGFEIAVDSVGNVLVSGRFEGTVSFGGVPLVSAGGREIYAAKFDHLGTHIESRRFGDSGSEEGLGIAADGLGNILMTGYFGNTIDLGSGLLSSAGGTDSFVAKYANLTTATPKVPALMPIGLLALIAFIAMSGLVVLMHGSDGAGRKRDRDRTFPMSVRKQRVFR